MSEKKYWKSFGELNLTESYIKETENEFQEDLPAIMDDGKGIMDSKHPRRDFLKYLGFSTAAATLAASCEMRCFRHRRAVTLRLSAPPRQ